MQIRLLPFGHFQNWCEHFHVQSHIRNRALQSGGIHAQQPLLLTKSGPHYHGLLPEIRKATQVHLALPRHLMGHFKAEMSSSQNRVQVMAALMFHKPAGHLRPIHGKRSRVQTSREHHYHQFMVLWLLIVCHMFREPT